MESAIGRLSLAILLGQDLAAILFLVTLPLLAGGTSGINLLQTGKALLLLGSLYGFSRYLLQSLLHRVLKTRSAELFRLTVLALTLGTAWANEQAGLSLALGAFLAGMALAESAYAHRFWPTPFPFVTSSWRCFSSRWACWSTVDYCSPTSPGCWPA
jgi:CPA2 family monovalent cation:H+ antiporter-2